MNTTPTTAKPGVKNISLDEIRAFAMGLGDTPIDPYNSRGCVTCLMGQRLFPNYTDIDSMWGVIHGSTRDTNGLYALATIPEAYRGIVKSIGTLDGSRFTGNIIADAIQTYQDRERHE